MAERATATSDWGAGNYEHIAPDLHDAAVIVVERAGIAAGERVVDVGCGTGNATFLAAARRARVVGVDPAERLLDVARAALASHVAAGGRANGSDVRFVRGDAASLPLDDASMDVAISVFAATFAPDAASAAAEIARVLTAKGRFVNAAWIPSGALFELAALRRSFAASTTSSPPSANDTAANVTAANVTAAPFAWHDDRALAGVFGPHGFAVDVEEQAIAFRAQSPAAFIDDEMRDHPLWAAACARLTREERDELRARALALLDGANEDRAAFRVTSRYVVARMAR